MISVAIDGPAGVGKSTVSKLLAKKLGWHCLDTGALYRAIAVGCQRDKIDINKEAVVANWVKSIKISISFDGDKQHTYLNGEDVTAYLRTKEIDMLSLITSAYKSVRDNIIDLQRFEATNQNLVVEGRDITSNVLKDSKNKFYLDASVEERALRRFNERKSRGENVIYEDILNDVIKRDKNDTTRKIAPLVKTKDAIIIDTTKMRIDEVVELIYSKLNF